MIQHAHPRDSYQMDADLWIRGRNVIAFVALVSWIATIAGAFVSPERFFQSYLVGFLFWIFIPLGAMFFVKVQYLTGSAWSVPMRRIAENVMITIPLGFLLFVPILFGLHELYHWSHADAVAHDKLLQAKSAYLNANGFAVRAFVFFAIWSLWAWRIYQQSVKQDRTHSVEHMHTISRWSAPGLLLLFLTVTLASFDWSMSLDPHWYSTIFGLYCFAGGGLAFICVWTLLSLTLRQRTVLTHAINVEHLHDLGKWMFAMTIFWAYIAFSQYVLIWYANIPEETVWFLHRFEGSWAWVSAAILFGHVIIPFFVLLPRASKRSPKVLKFAAWWLLAFQFVDFYWQVMPTFNPHGVVLHWLDLTAPLAVGSALGLLFWNRMKAHALLPVGDPRFEQGLHFQNL